MFVLLENRMSALQVPAPEQGVLFLKQRCNLPGLQRCFIPPKSKSYLYWQVNTFQCIPYPDGRLFTCLATQFIIWPLS